MLLPLQSQPRLPWQFLPQSNDWELEDYIYIRGRIYFHCTIGLQEIDSFQDHQRLCELHSFIVSVSRDSVSLPYVDLYQFTRA
jgi:hypothetical protein